MPIVSLLIEVLTRYPLEGQLWLFCTSCRHRSHGWGWEGIDWATMPSIVFTWLESTDSQGSSALLHVSFYACSVHCMAQQPPQVSKSMHTLLAPLTKADHPKLVWGGSLSIFYSVNCRCLYINLLHFSPNKALHSYK